MQSTIDNNKFSEKNFRYLGLFCLYRNFIVTVVNRSCDYCNKLGIMSRVSLNKLQCKLWCDILASSMGVLRLLRSQESGVEVSHLISLILGILVIVLTLDTLRSS